MSLPQFDGFTPFHPEGLRYTDVGNAQRFAAAHLHSLRYVGAWKAWYVFDGKRWHKDTKFMVLTLAKKTIEQMHRDARALPSDESRRAFRVHALASERAARLEAMIYLARNELAIESTSFDSHPMLLNVLNGTVDLKNGKLREHRAEDYLTQMAPVEFSADKTCPTYEEFLTNIFEKKSELIAFIQRWLGYSLTGCVKEQFLPVLLGDGANGKSTLVEVVIKVLGNDYCGSAPPHLLMASRQGAHPTEVADLLGKRFIVANETDSDRAFSETRVKELTSSQRLKARKMHENFWEFDSTHKLCLLTNHLPAVGGGDHAIWRRLKVIPFNVLFWNSDDPEVPGKPRLEGLRQDKDLAEKLWAERAGILAWLIRGCLAWQAEGLAPPEFVQEASNDYRNANDTVARFLLEQCDSGGTEQNAGETASELADAYASWCMTTGAAAIRPKEFMANLAVRYTKFTSNGTRYRGLRLKQGGVERASVNLGNDG